MRVNLPFSDAWLPPCGTILPHIPGALNLVTRDMERSILRYSPLPWTDDTTPRTDKPVRFVPRPHFWKKLAVSPRSRIA